MSRDVVVARLRDNGAALRARAVRAAPFGSRARSDDRTDGDTEIMIEIDPESQRGIRDCAGLKDDSASLFEGPGSVVDREGLKRYARRNPLRAGTP